MTEWFFDLFPLEKVVLFLILFTAIGAYYRWRFEEGMKSKIRSLEDQVHDLSLEIRDLNSEQESLRSCLDKLEEDLTPVEVKIKKLVDMGFPHDVATEAIVSGEIGGHKVK